MDKLKKLFEIMKAYASRGWYGKIEIGFENGSIVNVKVTESIKL